MFSHEQIDLLQQLVTQWLRSQQQRVNVEQAEAAADQLARVVGALVVDELIPSTAGRRSNCGSTMACPCGARARFVGYRTRDVGTVYKPVRVTRAYYHCRECRRGQLPWDEANGLNERLYTPRVKALVAQVSAWLPYQETVDLLGQTLGFVVEDSTAVLLTQEVGGRLRDQQSAQVGAYERGELVLGDVPAPGRLCVAMDGTSAHIDGGWHEVKTAVVYEPVVDWQGRVRAAEQRYVAMREPSAQFGARVALLAAESGAEQVGMVAVLGDGAEWIWHTAAEYYPGAVEVVDYWHACEHIHDLARVYYGEGSRQGGRWAREQCAALKRDGPGKLLRSLARMRPKTWEQREAVRLARGYFGGNRERMAYGEYARLGLPIGSGVVEAACKAVVGQRLKGPGMRWGDAGADAVLAIRAALLSRQPELVIAAARAA